MIASNLRQDEFLRKVDIFKETLRYRDEGTDGGFYCRDDMIKKVPDGGLGWSVNLDCNCYFDCVLCIYHADMLCC